jgi:hypothetical protein
LLPLDVCRICSRRLLNGKESSAEKWSDAVFADTQMAKIQFQERARQKLKGESCVKA